MPSGQRLPPETIAAIQLGYAAGESVRDIALRLGVNLRTCNKYTGGRAANPGHLRRDQCPSCRGPKNHRSRQCWKCDRKIRPAGVQRAAPLRVPAAEASWRLGHGGPNASRERVRAEGLERYGAPASPAACPGPLAPLCKGGECTLGSHHWLIPFASVQGECLHCGVAGRFESRLSGRQLFNP